jgi:TP901 family phage tail tape measure protein
MANRFSVEAVFKARDRITAPISKMQNRVGKFTRTTERNFRKLDRAADSFVNGMKRGAVAITASTALVTAGFANIIQAGGDFEQAITNVGAVGLKTRKEIEPLEKLALELGRTTKFTATQSANAMEILAKAGFETQDILKATPAILSAAAASGLEIAEVADHVSNALKGMGMETSEAARISDVLALASSRTNSTIGSLGESIRNVAATARELNIPFEEVAASVALLQDVGLDASVAGSAFNTMLTKMATPTAGMQKQMRRLGLSFKDAKGNMLPFQTVIANLNKASKKVGGNFDKVAFLAELVGLRGQKAASNLAELFETGKLEKLTKELSNAKGSAEKMAKLRMNTFQGSLTLLGSAVDAVKVKIFGMNEGPLKDTVDTITKWVGANEDLIATKIGGFLSLIVNNLGAIVKWGKRIGIVLGIIMSLILILKTFIVVMTAVNLVMALNPIGLIVIGIGLLITAIAAAIIWWDELKAAFMGLSGPAKTLLVVLNAPIAMMIAAPMLIMKAWEGLKIFFATLWTGILKGFDFVVDTFQKFMSKIQAVKSFFGFKSEEDVDEKTEQQKPQIVTSEEKIARKIEETKSISRSEVTIKDESGRAEITSGKLGPGLNLINTGAF